VGDAVHDLGAFLGPDSAREASAGPQAAARPAGDPLVALDLAGALAGGVERAVGLNERSEPIVSVAVPVRAGGGGAPIGVLALSTRGGEIGRIVREERALILQVFFVAALVSVGLSVLLANTIAAPIRRLAAAAESERSHAGRPVNPERTEIPDMTGRTDEIGELSAALIRMTEALYKRVEAIESFASDVAHEIKNPLTSLRSAVDTMIHAKTPEQRQRLLDVIKADVGRMDRLVTDISNASRLDAELVRERMAPFDLAAQIGMLAGVTETQGEARGVTVETRLPGGELVVQGLESRIAQVVANLLDNALSFSPDGGRIRVEAAEGAEVVRVSVSDEGPGIPPDSLASIFERFYTERPGAESFGSHSGLGLSISRQIVEAHGGRIWAENLHRPGDGPDAPPRGARFSFDLPR
jgi:two-component system sensor histidine kinase ChvG